MELAYSQSRVLNNNFIGTEHLLLGLIRDQDGAAGQVLAELGVVWEDAWRIIEGMQTEHTRSAAPTAVLYPKKAIKDRLSQTEASWPQIAREFIDVQIAKQAHHPVDNLCALLLEEREGRAAQLLLALGQQPEEILEMIWTELVKEIPDNEFSKTMPALG
jgi:ATP-dependent Clp protease ATP-binding subunit ClpC